MGQLTQARTRGPGSEWRRRQRRRRSSGSGGGVLVVLVLFRGPCRALQDLYEDWSAIYRNRIPLYLTLPLERSSQPPLCLTDCLPSLPPPASYPFSFSLPFAAFIQSFFPLRRSFPLFVPLLLFHPSLVKFFRFLVQ